MEKTVKVLIADENADIRAQLREQLGECGPHSVEEAANGEEALTKIARTHPDVVIVDL